MICRPLGCVVGNRWLTSKEKAEARGHVSRPQEEPERGHRGQSTQPAAHRACSHTQNLNTERGLSSSLSRHVPCLATESMAGERVAAELTSTLAEEAH